MRVSLRWLKDYVDVEMPPEELAERLTMAGLEVDAVEEVTPGFSNVVVAKILEITPHPNSDKLSLCRVTAGDRIISVVCGAPNIQVGQVVPLAQVGATIPGGYVIKNSRLRGEPSEGMLCSEEELGIGDDATGIMILPDTLPLGEDVAEALDLKDVVFDIGITPNRADCLSIIGVAREVAALTGKKIRYPHILCAESDEDIADHTSVQILSPHLCNRYTARMITDVTVRPSPAWMRLRLEAVGLRAINNIVDVTNFVMMELGQPLHAFDFRYLEEGRIVVRGSDEGESFVSLDGKSRSLSGDTLMICDGVKPVAIAGIMGGLNSEVVDDTDTVLLESAYFNPSSIRRSSRKLGMSTDAAYRFERGIDPEGVIRALDRAAQLIAELSGGTVYRNHIDEYPEKVAVAGAITLRTAQVNTMLGAKIGDDEICRILESLEIDVTAAGEGVFTVTPPSFRVDIWREIDLIEEIARLYGYEKIPVTIPVVSEGADREDRKAVLIDRVRNILNGNGYSEVINYSFTTPESAEVLGFGDDDRRRRFVRIKNPLTEDSSVMRTGLVYGLLDTVKRNVNAGNFNLKFFEIGKAFIGEGKGELPREEELIAAVAMGLRYEESWHFKEDRVDFYDLKGCLETMFRSLRIDNVRFESSIGEPFLHPGRSCGIVAGNERIGVVGEIHPDVMKRMDVKSRPVVFEMDLTSLVDRYSSEVVYREIPRVPSSSRDVAFLVDEDLEGARLIASALEKSEELLESIEIFDVYCGAGVPEGKKSVALRFTYRSPGRTLTDDEVNDIHGRIVKRVVVATGAAIRGAEVKDENDDKA
jgi:phenylalanyl-tRNA synthetase beta chain